MWCLFLFFSFSCGAFSRLFALLLINVILMVPTGEAEFRDPTESELLKLAGGELDMVYTGKPGMELRTVLAQRVRH